MTHAALGQLGMDLATGAPVQAGPIDTPAAIPVTAADRHDHFIRRDGKVFAGTHLIVEVDRKSVV